MADVDVPVIEDVTRIARQQIRLNSTSQSGNVPLESRQSGVVALQFHNIDQEETKKVEEFCATGCGCRLVKGRPCSFQFSEEHYATTRANAAELSWNELNMAVMGQVMALTFCDPVTLNSTVHRHASTERQKTTTVFHHQGHRVCRTTFLFLHGIGEYRLKAIKARYLSDGLVPRVHGHTGRTPWNALVREDVEHIISFVTQYCETNAILLPGRVPGYKRDDVQILPCITTKRSVWGTYRDTCFSLSAAGSILLIWQGVEALSPTCHRCAADD